MPSIILAKKSNVDANTEALETLEGRVDNIVGQTGDSNTEIVDARYSPVTGVTHTVLTDRITSVENELLTKDTASVTEYASVAELGDTVADSVVDGNLDITQSGITITNMVNGASIADAGTVSFDTITGDKYYDTLNETIITGDGTTKTATNSSGATADMAIYHLNDLGLQAITDTSILADLLPYVSGTKSVPRLGYRVVGENLFDGILYYNGTALRSKRILLNPSKTYFFYNDYTDNLAWYDEDGDLISFASAGTGKTITGYSAIRIGRSGTEDLDLRNTETMLNLGSSSLPYVPYAEQLRFFDHILRGVPAIKDTIKTVPDGFEHTQNTSADVSLSDTDFDSYDGSTYTNVDVVLTTAISLAKAGTTAKDGMLNLFDSDGTQRFEVAQADIDNTSSVGGYYWHTDKTIAIILADGAYADIATARTGLGTMTVNYQLATPVTTHIPMPGLSSVEGGSIQRFPAQRIQQEYGTGLTFDEDVLSVIKATKLSGGETVDITDDAVISGTGVTFSPAPNATDPVDVRSELDVDAPIGQLDYTVPINRASLMTDTAERTRENSNDIYDLQEQIDLLIIATA